jgi:hypothetical protein
MKKLGKALGAVAIAGAIAASGSAFTASNTLPSSSVTRGYGAQTITGVTAQSVDYVLDTAAEKISGVDLVLTGDTTAKTIEIAFSGAAPAACSDSGTFDTDHTNYSCVFTAIDVSTASKFALIASD